ncbi:hypothetical protein [Archangium sp.]|uniref:hypothetical protein n=1 Tax=Archangium sp. TaxID=1872627 RepID=UPI00389AA379
MLTPLLYAALLSAAPVSSTSSEEPQSAPAVEATPASSLRAKAPIIAGVGATLALSGAALWIAGTVQQGDTASSQTTEQSLADLPKEERRARQNMLGGAALTLVGACAVGVSVVMWSWAPEQPRAVSASVRVSPHGGVLSLTGKFP